VILPAGGHNQMGHFTDLVKLTRALVQNLDEAVKEVKLLGEHEEESSQRITELEALCKKLREDTQRCYWRSLGRRDWAAWVRMKMRKKKKRMRMTEEMPPHPFRCTTTSGAPCCHACGDQ
jgi:hypothetical protein